MALAGALLCCLFALTGCGGGVDESLVEGLVFNFTEAELSGGGSGGGGDGAASAAAENVVSPFSGIGLVDLEQGFRVAYLHDMQSLVDDLKSSRRTIAKLGETGTEGEGQGLDWVVQVYDAHLVSEELRFRIYNYPFSDDLALEYVDWHADFLRGVEIYTLCADRLLEGSLMIDPEGSTADFSPAAMAEYRSLIRESGFYCGQAEALHTRSGEELREQISRLRFS